MAEPERARALDIDLEYWRHPKGVVIPDDELKFLLVPDAVEAAMVFALAKRVHEYQREHAGTERAITKAVMVTMGGLLPGVYLHDHLAWSKSDGLPGVEFGTLGVELYEGPGKRLSSPRVVQDLSISVSGETTLAVDDLGDFGGTMGFVRELLGQKGAREVLTFELYSKPQASALLDLTFSFGAVDQDTWIITPRELVETLMKRVPLWKERGAPYAECRRRLVALIGYPTELVDYYLPMAYGE